MKKLSTFIHEIACDIAKSVRFIPFSFICILCIVSCLRKLSRFSLYKYAIFVLVLRVIVLSHAEVIQASVQDIPTVSSAYPLHKGNYVNLTNLTQVTSNHLINNVTVKGVDFERLAEAIRRAENSKNHPYGILKPYCTARTEAQCRKGCLQTIDKRYRLWLEASGAPSNTRGFISYLSQSYAPLNAKNDPSGLNVNWIKNVTHFYKEAL